jgi:hypothetical protein
MLVLGALLMWLSACSKSSGGMPKPPPNAGTAAIHAKWTAGPCDESGRCAGQGVMGGSEIVLLRLGSGERVAKRANKHGDADFRVAPGLYRARYTRAFLSNACGAGASVAQLRVRPHDVSRGEIVCTNP